MANANLGVLVCAPDDAVAADIVEEKEAGPERGLAHFGVPYEEAAGERPGPTCAAARELDAVLFVGEKHEHVAIARVEGRVVPCDRHPLAELAGHAPLAIDPVAEAIDEQVDYVGVPDAAIVRAVDRAQLADVAVLGEEDANIFDTAGEAQIVVEAIGDVGGGLPGLTEVARRRVAGAGQ